MDFNPTGTIGSRKWTWEEDGYTVIRSNARTAPGCHENCGILMYVKDGKLVKVEGDPENPYNNGRLCPRCLCLNEMLYHPDRLLYPMKRDPKDRGKNTWEQITWDEAYEIIKERITSIQAQYGKECLYLGKGTGRDTNGYLYRLADSFGTPNFSTYLSGIACYNPRIFGTAMKFGDMIVADYAQFYEERYDDPRYEIPEYCLVWGCNPVVANSDGTLGHWVTDLMKRGTKIIVVDPKAIWLAGRAEYYVPLRPGTDGELANAISGIIIQENLYDHEFVDKWCSGFDEFKKHCADYPVNEAARICGISPQLIVEVAHAIGNAKNVIMQWGVAISQCTEGCIAGMALMDLLALTGNIEKPGSNVVCRATFGIGGTWRPKRFQSSKLSARRKDPNDPNAELSGVGTEKLLTPEIEARRMNMKYAALQFMGLVSPDMITKAMNTSEPYPIKIAWLHSCNAVAGSPADSTHVYSGLMQNEFNVCVDLFMTPTIMGIADVFLPAACYPERNGLTGHNPYYLGSTVKAIEPQGEAKSDNTIICEVSRLFNEDANPWVDDMDLYQDMLAEIGTDFEEIRNRTWAYPPFEYFKHEKGLLRADGKPGFNTPSGKYEFYSETLELFGESATADYTEPPESPLSAPALAAKYPLVLTTGARRIGLFHSEHRQCPSMRFMHPNPLATINTETAAKYGISEGDWMTIENSRGKVRLKAEITDGIRPDTISADHGWWFPERDPGDDPLYGTFESNINCIIPSEPGHCGFGAPYKSVLCKIHKYEEGSGE